MGKKSRDKGKRGEREAAKEIAKLFNIPARRGVQHSGSPNSPDIVAFKNIHIEVKRVERLQLYQSLEQSQNDAGKKVPIVMHRKNRKEWVVIVNLKDLKRLSKEVIDATIHV